MNIFQKIKTLWTVKGVAQDIQKEATQMDGTKPGWKTTEFWLTVLGTNIPTLIGAISGVIPPKIAAVVLAVANGVYGLIRAITKNGSAGSSDASANVTVKAS